MTKYEITTQRQLRAAFWQAFPNASRKKIKDHRGDGLMYTTDVRCEWVNFVDHLQKYGFISEALAERAEL